jgi:hypothetical protein
MAKQLKSCCSRFYRNLLIAFNIFILIIGIVITILASLLKYSEKFKSLINLKELTEVVNVAQINAITLLFLIIGIFAIILSIVGLLGLWCLNRVLLIAYEIVILLMFLTHGIGLLVLIFDRGSIENQFKKAMGTLVVTLNTNETSTNIYKTDCDTMLALSDIFKCCGDKAPSDFKYNTTIHDCCGKDTTPITHGCSQKVIDTLTKNAINYLIIPSCSILAVELIVIIVTPLIMRDIRSLKYD